jgi:magnesium-transporting ATPase (P-type)
VLEVFYLFNSRSLSRSNLTLATFSGNRAVLLAVLVVVLLQALFTYAPLFRFLFQSRPLSGSVWILLLAIGVAAFLIVELERSLARRLGRRPHPAAGNRQTA